MSKWKETIVNLGKIKEGSVRMIKYESLYPLDIDHVSPSCASCSSFIDYKNNILTIRFTAPQVSRHLRTTVQSVSKGATVYYDDGTSDYLEFKAIIKK